LQPTPSAAVARQVIERLRPRIEETKADIALEVLPVVNADETQLEQLLQNLVGNALKFRLNSAAKDPGKCVTPRRGMAILGGGQWDWH
jgi:light-regulated signal transduction histidine kinase (bacteriophytochrome)